MRTALLSLIGMFVAIGFVLGVGGGYALFRYMEKTVEFRHPDPILKPVGKYYDIYKLENSNKYGVDTLYVYKVRRIK
jgi:hypothetical protein